MINKTEDNLLLQKHIETESVCASLTHGLRNLYVEWQPNRFARV